MRKNFGAKPYTYPQPVFIVAAYGPDGTPDAMNAAWGGISDTTELSLCLSAGHKTTKNILERKAMSVECRLVSYDPDTGHLVGAIVNVSVDESVLTPEGKVDVSKLDPITFDPVNSAYHKLGEKVGNAFADGLKLK